MLSHKQKIKLARKLRTKEEQKRRISIFATKAWEDRKQSIENRVNRKQKPKGGEKIDE